jgi:cytochrome c553
MPESGQVSITESSRKVVEMMNVTTSKVKKFALFLIILPLVGVCMLNPNVPVRAGMAGQDFDAAAFFKAKCAMCHGAKSEKNFDTSKTDEQHVEIILKGSKPKMPEYGTKGVTADQAKALVTLMKELKGQATD